MRGDQFQQDGVCGFNAQAVAGDRHWFRCVGQFVALCLLDGEHVAPIPNPVTSRSPSAFLPMRGVQMAIPFSPCFTCRPRACQRL